VIGERGDQNGENDGDRLAELGGQHQREKLRLVSDLCNGHYRGKFLCSRCLITLTKDNLDKSYTLADIGLVMSDVFKAPGAITRLATSTCALCARRKHMQCLGVPLS
jgi:hypothetical protein